MTPLIADSAAPGGEHWGVVVRPEGCPGLGRSARTGKDRLWNREDSQPRVPGRARLTQSVVRWSFLPHAPPAIPRTEIEPARRRLRSDSGGLPAADRLFVLPSAALTAIPIEALLEPDDPRTVSYAPSASVLTYLRTTTDRPE